MHYLSFAIEPNISGAVGRACTPLDAVFMDVCTDLIARAHKKLACHFINWLVGFDAKDIELKGIRTMDLY